MAGRTTEYYRRNPKALAKKRKYDKRYNARPEEVDRRETRNAARRQAEKRYGKSALRGKDVHHKDNMRSGLKRANRKSNISIMSSSRNRAKH